LIALKEKKKKVSCLAATMCDYVGVNFFFPFSYSTKAAKKEEDEGTV
jgi:hypothetical protein